MNIPYLFEQFTKHILKEKINTIFELGTNDASFIEPIISYYEPNTFISFECNPQLISICQEKINKLKNNTKIEFVPKALYSSRGHVNYWSIDSNSPEILGSSSIYKHKYLPTIKQQIETTTLDYECDIRNIKTIDLICSDIEGAEYEAFKNQKILNNTKYIITEVVIDKNWRPGSPTLQDISSVLREFGFEMAEYYEDPTDKPYTPYLAGDALFINKKI